jgi:hypothetical protein
MTWGVWRSASGFGPQIGGVVNVPADAPGAATTFDSTNEGAEITLTNGDLTATATGTTGHCARSTSILGAGKRVVKWTTTDTSTTDVGIANGSFSLNAGTWMGNAGLNACSWASGSGEIHGNGAGSGFFASELGADASPVWLAIEDTGAAINFYISTDGSSWSGATAAPIHVSGDKYFCFQGWSVGVNMTVDFNPSFSGLTGGVAWDA